jgi:hypothetical protein
MATPARRSRRRSRHLPWYQSFFRFGYLDAARLDETSSETLLGNFWLACYLKDLGTAVPDRRFDFMVRRRGRHLGYDLHWNEYVSTLGAVNLTSTNTLKRGRQPHAQFRRRRIGQPVRGALLQGECGGRRRYIAR